MVYRRHILNLLCAVLVLLAWVSRPVEAGEKVATGQPIHVLCSFFPIYQFTRNIAAGREGVQVELMLPATMGCPHDYLLTPQDMAKIARADVFVANGLGLEEFLGAPLTKANPNVKVIDAAKGITELIVSSGEAGEKRSGEAGRESEAPHHAGPNPHLFASPAMAARMVQHIAEGLAKADPAGAILYRNNAKAYTARLQKLSDELATESRRLRARKIVTTHAVFDYLARQGGLEIVAVIEETPGQEPSAAQMLNLIKTIKQSGAAVVFTEPQYSAGVGRTIAREAGVPLATLDPVASGPETAPLSYYESVMRKNIETLWKTLGEKQ